MLKVEREVTALKRHRLRRPEFLSNVQNSTVDGGEERTPLKTKFPVHEGGQPAVHIQKDTEGIHAFVQTGACRRKVIAEVF